MGAFRLGGVDALASSATQGPGLSALPAACRVTVLRRECFEDLQALYLDDPDEGPCTSFKEGEKWLFEKGATRPPEFCPRVWNVILKSVGTGMLNCCKGNEASVISCPDGTRPVLFLIAPA